MIENVDRFAIEYIEAQKAAWERSDFSGLKVLEDPSVVFQNINGTVFNGRDAHLQAIKEMKDRFEAAPITQDWQYILSSGDVFSLAYTWTIHSTQRPLRIAGILVGRIRDHKLIEEWGANYPVEAEESS